jgi:Phosphodiester glycosidase
MNNNMSNQELLALLKNEKINTWFDLGLFIDKFREYRPLKKPIITGNFDDFKTILKQQGVAFISYYYAIDGVTIEVDKYAKSFQHTIPDIPIHYIAGKILPESEEFISPEAKKYEIKEILGFDNWPLYKDFFFTKLERGSKEYNSLIIDFWNETISIVDKLGKYIEENNLGLLYLLNVCSNPGNVSLSFAIVLISEFMGIPVINNSHDYYWEGGNKEIVRKTKRLKKGPRDFFFTNAHIGEFFTLIEMLFPWESRSWVTVNINNSQSKYVIEKKGHNPASVMEIGTAIDTRKYINITKRTKINTYYQLEKVLSRYKDTLIGYSVDDVVNSNLVDPDKPEPIIVGAKTKCLENFMTENVIFLQPTRIIGRKRIEVGFKMVKKLFQYPAFANKFKDSQKLKLTILITGPIPSGQVAYFEKLLQRFHQLIEDIQPEYKERIHLAFLFSEIDIDEFKKRFDKPMGIPELYNIASLILLPSKTEGRGLPIIEATATGVPIFCNRYTPEIVYSEVIGENLPEEDRLKVIEFDGKKVKPNHIREITRHVFFPHKYVADVEHNVQAVKKRFSLEALSTNIEEILMRLYCQISDKCVAKEITIKAIGEYHEKVNFSNKDLDAILNSENRHYLPGYGRLKFMNYLKSLIDPSFFRVEEQEMRGIAFYFACNLIKNNPDKLKIPQHQKIKFFNAVDSIFRYRKGEHEIKHDHSISYRHRNTNFYPYQEYTIQELTGLINLLHTKIIQPEVKKDIESGAHFFTDWNLALVQLTSSDNLEIDDRKKLLQKLKANIPIAHFPSKYVKYELELFALQPLRAKLKLPLHIPISEDILRQKADKIEPVYIFAQEFSIGRWATAKQIEKFIVEGKDDELKLLYKHKLLQIVMTTQLSVGIHFPQLGEVALKKLHEIKKKKGIIISNRRNAAIMTDIVDIDRFHIGRVTYEIASNILGIPIGSGYIQFVPAGVRPTLAYPTPIQTAKDFYDALHSDKYKKLCKELGEDKVLGELRKDAETNGSPVSLVIENLSTKGKTQKEVAYQYISGVYDDGMPYNGVLAKIDTSKKPWQFSILSSEKTKKVTDFIKDFEAEKNVSAKIAWNGGYILNPELVGKLGLPENYIGSPLGLLISSGEVLSAPLFNKPALIIYNDGSVDIKKVNVREGISIKTDNKEIVFTKQNYNIERPNENPAFYDLMYSKEEIIGNGRTIVRLAGNSIKEIRKTKPGEKVKIIPVGLTLSFPKKNFPEALNNIDKKIEISINGLDNIKHAVEAGPMLVNNNATAIDMENEGWKTDFSIRTQAARLDYTDMRGPKIAVGINEKGELVVLTINGRIRESVGATHIDMANIMLKYGIKKAMGFDPGGSSTLVVNGETMNISPYNSKYEENNYAMSPEPRAVANAVIGYLD